MLPENEISRIVIGIAIDVHTVLGAGLLERVYKECLFLKLEKAGLSVEKEKHIPIIFEEVRLDCGYRIDLVVEKMLFIEIKSVSTLNEVHLAQTINYMKLGEYKLGLLINFNVVR